MTHTEVLKLAQEALTSCDAAHITDGGRQWYDEKLVDKALTAIDEALAQPQQEPDDLTIAYMAGLSRGKDLAPQRKPLTDDEVLDCWKQAYEPGCRAYDIGMRMARAIEAAHGIKE